MLHLHCYAKVTDNEAKLKLLTKLRHHNTPFTEKCDEIHVDANFLSYRSIEKIVSYFEETEAEERGFSVIGEKGEVTP